MLSLNMAGNAATEASNSVTITSSAVWRLAGDGTWCNPSVSKGNNSETVTFTAAANETGKYREVDFYFICGDASQKLTVIQSPEEVVEFGTMQDNYAAPSQGHRLTVRLTTNLDVFNCDISEPWVTLRAEKNDFESKWLQFIVAPTTVFTERSATVTMFKGTAAEKSFVITQERLNGIVLDSPAGYTFGVDGGKVTITARSNIDFAPSLTTKDAVWLHATEISSSVTEHITKTYEIACDPGVYLRTGTITLKPTTGTSVNITVSQTNPNLELFDLSDPVFASALLARGFIAAKDNRHYMTYDGYIATSVAVNQFPKLKSIEGIERFVNMKSLMLNYSEVKRIDVSKNPAVTSVRANSIPLEELILGDNNATVEIDNLYAGSNDGMRSQSFTVSGSKLRALTIDFSDNGDYNELQWIDITGCPAMADLFCDGSCAKLEYIYVTQAQKNAYDAGTLEIETNQPNVQIVVK